MGCSPSKGKLFSKPEAPGPHSALPAEAPPDSADCGPEEDQCLGAEEKENEPPQLVEELHVKETADYQLASDETAAPNAEDIREIKEDASPRDAVSDLVQTERPANMEKRKKTKGKRKSAEKRRKSSVVHAKVDFPPHMVRAHQAAYTFLNPNISKYETLLGLLDQAAQTQLSLQPMMSALVMRFEEINQALEEMAEEGELMLKEHGDYMALPSGMLGPALMSAKPSMDAANPSDPPPDLLQQLLQHSTEKMRQVGTSVQTVGDTTLEEAMEYFSSLSKLLVEKMRAKQTAEQRLAQVLARVEVAALRKSNPEDSALHSEDSGIGGENESLTGSERHRRHRGSAGSGSCGSGVNIRGDNTIPNLPNLVDHNEDEGEDEEEEEEDDDDEEDDDEDGDVPRRNRSNSSPPDPSQALSYLRANYIKDQHLKRTLAPGTSPEESLSTRCVNILLELQKNQTDLDHRIKNMADIQENKELPASQYNLYRAGIRRHSLNVSASLNKGLFRSIQPPCSLPKLVPKPPKRNSVRRLINTFSQGADGRPGQSLANIPPHIRKPKKSESLSSDRNEGGFIINGNNNNNSWPDSRDDMDADSLPPPPPEVLLDNSFQRTEGLSRNEEGSQESSVRSLPMINQKTGLSQRLKASLQNVDVLPNRASVKPRSVAVLSTRPVRQDAVAGAQEAEHQSAPDLDPEIEKANCLYQQARKIIHLRDSVESSDKRKLVNTSVEFYEGDAASCSSTVTAPPVSRVRLPPSCPSVSHRFPSPPAFRPQTASKTSSRPSSPRAVTRASDKTPEEIVPSVSFRDARSVFCQNESQTPRAPGSCVLPRRFGEASRGRLSARETDSPTRRTRSEQRSGRSAQSEFSRDGRLAPGNDGE